MERRRHVPDQRRHGALRGVFHDSAQVPSLGVPYVLRVQSGTGELAGATGRCVLENHLRRISTYVQEQRGGFVCDIAR